MLRNFLSHLQLDLCIIFSPVHFRHDCFLLTAPLSRARGPCAAFIFSLMLQPSARPPNVKHLPELWP